MTWDLSILFHLLAVAACDPARAVAPGEMAMRSDFPYEGSLWTDLGHVLRLADGIAQRSDGQPIGIGRKPKRAFYVDRHLKTAF